MQWENMKPENNELEPLTVDQILGPVDVIKETSPAREWGIRKIQEKFGLDRQGAESLIDREST